MFLKLKRKKATTLVEVIISLAITAILIIPAMNMITGSTRNIQKTKEKERAEFIAKEIVEEIKAIEDWSALVTPNPTDLTIKPSRKLSNTTTKLENKNYPSDNDLISGEDIIDDKYKVNVKLVKRDDINYVTTELDVDAELDIYFDNFGALKIKKTGEPLSAGIIINTISETNKETETILIENKTNDITINSSNINSSNIGYINKKKISDSTNASSPKTGFLRINLLDSTSDFKINLEVKNEMPQDFNLYISKRKNSKFDSDVEFGRGSNGAVIITKDEFTLESIGDIYDLTVTVTKKGETQPLVTLNGYKNINFE